MAPEDVTNRLLDMIAANGSETPGGQNDPERDEAQLARDNLVHDALEARTPDLPPSGTGRGPTGRLRNFRAMNGAKLIATLDAVTREANDDEALEALLAEARERGLA